MATESNVTRKTKITASVAVNIIIAAVLVAVCIASAGGAEVAASAGNKAVYRGDTAKAEVTLMFNVYWGTEYIPQILKTLEAYNVKTTFFVGGSWVSKNVGVFESIVEAGHEIGSHGYMHRDADKLGYKQNVDEIVTTHKLVKELSGIEMTLFAPPSGAIGKDMFSACEANGYTVIMWSRDTIDWRDKDRDLVYKRATEGIQNGELVLMHPTAHTLDALPDILEFYSKAGISAVTVSHNLAPAVA